MDDRKRDTIMNGGKANCQDCLYLERACAEHGGGDDENDKKHDLRQQDIDALVTAAQDALTDERHWSVTEVGDRADSAAELASLILKFLGVDEDDCPDDCEECEEHKSNTGGDERS